MLNSFSKWAVEATSIDRLSHAVLPIRDSFYILLSHCLPLIDWKSLRLFRNNLRRNRLFSALIPYSRRELLSTMILSLTILRYVFRDLNHKIIKLTPFSNYYLRVIIIWVNKVMFYDLKSPLTPHSINNKCHFRWRQFIKHKCGFIPWIPVTNSITLARTSVYGLL